MKKDFFLIFLMLSCYLKAQTEINLSKVQISEDLAFLVKTLETVSITPYDRINKDIFYSELEKSKDRLNHIKNVRVADFYKSIQPVIVKLEDGHTELNISQQISERDYFIFPFKLKIRENGIFIYNIKNDYNLSPDTFLKKRISNLNGYSSKNLLKEISDLTSGETKKSRIELSEYYFNVYYNLLFENLAILNIRLEDGNNYKIPLIRKSQRLQQNQNSQPQQKYSYVINTEKKLGILSFNEFSNYEDFKIFLEKMFQDFKKQNVGTFIIDIRNNGGGDSKLGDELLKYLVKRSFRQYEKTIVQVSELGKENFKNDDSNTSINIENYLRRRNGNVFMIDKTNDYETPYQNKIFGGKTYLVTSGQTFSSAADFANAFKFYKVGKIIGEETGGFVISKGETIETQLPNSKLIFSVSTAKDFDIGSKNTDFHGVVPDIKINAEAALDYIINHFTKKN